MNNSQLVAASVLASVISCAAAQAAILSAGFSEFAIAQNIEYGTEMEFSPDGKLFVLEQMGTIEVYSGSGATSWTRVQENFLINTPLGVGGGGEYGLLGIAFDPQYLQNHFVYLQYTSSDAPVRNRVVRLTANSSGDLAVAGSLSVIMELEPLTAGLHCGGAIHFGMDGKLYVASGDDGLGSNSQSISTRNGKILRLNPDPNAPIPADNPQSISGIPGTTSGANRAIWAAGLRNPFTFAFHPVTGMMIINDVGAGEWEELNVGSPSANYGWPATEGPFHPAAFPNFTNPVAACHHIRFEMSVPPTPGFVGRAFSGGAFYSTATPTFPVEYHNDYFIVDYVGGWIKRIDLTSGSVIDFAWNIAEPLGVRVGSDGALYYLGRNSGCVFRVQIVCTGDLNASNSVDVSDLLAVITNWGPCANPSICPADVNNDGNGNVFDLLAVVTHWGACP